VNIVLDALLLFCSKIDDATPVMLIVFLLFVLPANLDFLQFNSNGKSLWRSITIPKFLFTFLM